MVDRTVSMRRAALAAALFAAVAAVGTHAPATAAFPDRAHRVAVFADSVGLGARTQIPAAFGDGWYVNVDGQPARFVEQMEAQYVRPRLATNPEWFGDHVVIAAGYNAPYWDWARFDRSIDSIIGTLTAAGVKHIYWVTLREVTYANTPPGGRSQIELYGFYFPIVNQHLEAALARHPNLTLIDWAATGSRPGMTYDAIHLNTAGAALYSDLIRQAVTSTATRLPDQAVSTIAVPGAAGAAAAFVNLTTVDPRTAGFLAPSASGCATANVSVHNYVRAETAAHSAIVPLAPDGTLCVRNRAATNLVVDTGGVFPAGAGFVPITPQRWADTRAAGVPVPAGGELRLDLAGLALPVPPGDVAALALSVTAVDASGAGWLRVLPCGTTAPTSNVNYLGGAPTPNLVVSGVSTTGQLCVTTRSATHIVVDAFGVFTEAADVLPRSVRAFDSRAAGERVAAQSVTRIELADVLPVPTEPAQPGAPEDSSDVRGLVLNLTAVDAERAGYLTAYPCAAGRPHASNLNVANHLPASNAAIVAPDGDGAVCVFAQMPTHLIVDVQATLGAAFDGRTPQRLLDTRIASG